MEDLYPTENFQNAIERRMDDHKPSNKTELNEKSSFQIKKLIVHSIKLIEHHIQWQVLCVTFVHVGSCKPVYNEKTKKKKKHALIVVTIIVKYLASISY